MNEPTKSLPTIFVSYSHADKEWLTRFKKVFAPLGRYTRIDLWSDERIKAGDNWQDEINKALEKSVAAVLLVSIDFLASQFVADTELPYILAAAKKRQVTIFWVRLTPCLFEVTPLRDIQAAEGIGKPLNEMEDYEWMTALCKVCGNVDALVKEFETPVLDPDLNGKRVEREERKLKVLAKPAVRDTEVLVYAGGDWYTQGRVAKGSVEADCWFGTERANSGSSFKIVALTLPEGHLVPASRHPNFPSHRTKSAEATVKRK